MNKILKIEKNILMGALAIMLAAFLWSLDGVFIRPKFYHFSPGLVVFLEHIFGLVVLSPFVFSNWTKIKDLNKKDWGAIFWVSVFGGLVGTLMITKAFFAAVMGEVTFATVVILQKLQPFFAIVMARLVLKERLSRVFYIWTLVAIVSAGFLSFGKTGLDLGGIDYMSNAAIFAVIAAFAFGSSTVFGKRIVNHLDFKSATALRFAVTSLLALAYVLFTSGLGEIGEFSRINWLYLVLIVFSSGAFAMFIYYFGLRRVTASTATICELFWPLSAVILDYFINGNVLNFVQIIASLVLIFAFFKVVKNGNERGKEFIASVVGGDSRGQKLGYPTINLSKTDLDIVHGVYSVDVIVGTDNYLGLMHFGPKETFSGDVSLELYLKEFIFDIPSSDVKVRIRKKIRDVVKFSDIEKLKNQIKKDIEKYL